MIPNYRIYGYLRASTKEQDALRAKNELIEFAKQADLSIASFL
jgi:DNA invertase Pin-like site-specific DNA recombinase